MNLLKKLNPESGNIYVGDADIKLPYINTKILNDILNSTYNQTKNMTYNEKYGFEFLKDPTKKKIKLDYVHHL